MESPSGSSRPPDAPWDQRAAERGMGAVAEGQQVQMRSRPGLPNASSSDSDRYEELLVNPTLLLVATARQHRLRRTAVSHHRLGHFQQLVIPAVTGQISIAFELDSNPADRLRAILPVLARHGLSTACA
jgi:hypothetical protein